MATGVGLTQISLTQLNRQTPKTPYLAHESCGSSENLNDSVWSANPQNPSLVQNSGTYLKCELSYGKFCVEISKFSFPWKQGLVWHKFHIHS